jgi:hypothetical protein
MGTSIYGLCCPLTGELRYIGKANDPAKRLDQHMRDSRSRATPLYSWIRKHGKPALVVLEADCPDWREAERRLIAKGRLDGLRLLNIADGGDEPHCPTSVRAANALLAVKARPKHIVRAYRVMEANIRSLKRLGSHDAASRATAKLQRIRELIDLARHEGRLGQVDQSIGEFLNGRASNGLPA